MQRTLSIFCALLLLVSLVGCGSGSAAEKLGGLHTDSGDVYPEEFLTFDNEEVSFDEFRYYYLNYRDMYLEEDPDYFSREGAEKALKEEVLQCLLDSWAVRFLAKENDVSLDREEKETVQTNMQDTIALFGSEESFLEDLHASYMSRQYYETMMNYSSLYYKLFNTLFEAGGKEAYTDEEFYEYYEKNYLAVQELFLPFADGETADACPDTLARAAELRQKAEDGADFWALIEEYGEDENMLRYPDGYYITEGQAEDALYEASKALEIDGISEPVAGQTGVYLIRRVAMKRVRMDENRDIALFGYRDSLDEWHAGEYDRVFQELYRERAEMIKIEYGKYWDLVSTGTVF